MKENEKIALIDNYFSKLKDKTIVKLSITNYEEQNIYIVLNASKKSNNYYLSWINLNLIEDKKIEPFINYQYIEEGYITYLTEKLNNTKLPKKYIVESSTENSIKLKIELNNISYIYEFNNYLPYDLEPLLGCVFLSIFDYLPKLLTSVLNKLISLYNGTNWLYEYKKTFDFDLETGNINDLFEDKIIERGDAYYKMNKVKYLEKIENKYFAVVEGNNNNKYVVIINYDKEAKKMNVYCDCPCEFYCKHIYAVLKNIKNKHQNRFYKIAYKKNSINLLERIMNFDYLLCLGIIADNFEVINKNGQIEYIPILNNNWEVIEDDMNRSLLKRINEILERDNE